MENIGAEAARLAGLQIDLLSKYRAEQLSLDHFERFLNLTPEAREERFGDGKKSKTISAGPVEKFTLLADLGIITVPEVVSLDKFMRENRKKFYGVNENITDANFPNPSRILKPGDKLWVRAFQQIVKGGTTSEERMKFLKKQNAVFTGAQGATLVFDQKRDELPKGKWYASFDEKDRLWEDAGGDHRVPGVLAHSDGDFYWFLGSFGYVWDGSSAFLCFCDVPSGT